MKILVVVKKGTADMLWAHSNKIFISEARNALADDEVVIELSDQTVQKILDLFDEETLDRAIQLAVHTNL